jgi:membrane protein implicated in regulation of membrane protease activity
MRENTLEPGVGADRLVGLVGIVTVPISSVDTERRGRVTIDGEVWGAVTETPDDVASGTQVRVLSMKGTRVVVSPIVGGGSPTDDGKG